MNAKEMKKDELNEQRYMDIAAKMDLIHSGPVVGGIYWKPNGAALYENLRDYIKKVHIEYGYSQVKSPSMVNAQLFEQSGHSQKYKENMFFLEDGLALRPMSCPNHIVIYDSNLNSFNDLPLKLFEFGEVFRNEASGALQVLFRQRQFCQDDAHIFAKDNDLEELLLNYLNMSEKVYKELGFESVEYMISLRPDQRFGSDDIWDKAEEALKNACLRKGVKFGLEEKGGAFYGPKIELKVKDKLGRYWQMGVIQLDYVMPERFNLFYIDGNNEKQRPIILHHAVLGSLERMIAILLEVMGADLPEFLHPVKSIVLPVSEKSAEYAKVLQEKLRKQNGYSVFECPVDYSSNSLQKKILNASQRYIPNIYVVGEKEAEEYSNSGVVAAMLRKNGKSNKVVLD